MNTHRTDSKKDEFRPTFTGGRQEQRWIEESLGGFFADGWLTDILYRVKGGKEATVYCCKAHPATGHDLIAAKVFRPRMFRAIRQTTKPCLAFKILAAGRLCDRQESVVSAFRRTFEQIKPTDTVIVGMYPEYEDQVSLNASYTRRFGGVPSAAPC